MTDDPHRPSAAAKLVERWTSDGVEMGSGCSAAELAAFESAAGASIPADLRELLLRANGAGPDAGGFRFWSLREYGRYTDQARLHGYEWPSQDDDGTYYVFADYLDWSWAYAIRLAEHGKDAAGGRVIPVGMNQMFTIAESFSAFVDLYLADSPLLYPPEPSGVG